jgi:hypothetical protein
MPLPINRNFGDIVDNADINAIATAVNDLAATGQQKTASFTAALVDAGKVTECESSTAIVATIPPMSSVTWPADTVMEFAQTGTGELSVTGGAGVTLHSADAPAGLKARSRWASVFVRKRTYTPVVLNTTNLVLDMDADDVTGADQAAVSSWAGTGGTFSQATATNQPKVRTNFLDGHRTVEFDGVDNMLSADATALGLARNRANMVFFIVYKMPGTAVTGTRAMFALSTGTTTGSRVLIQQNVVTTNIHQAAGRRLDTDSFVTASASSGSTTGEVAVLTALYRWVDADLFLIKNGTQIASNTSFQTAGSTSDTASLTGFIGANANGTGEFFSGHIARILAYVTPDTDASLRGNVHSYLKDTYPSLPTPADYTGTTVNNEWIVSGDTKA